MGQTKARCADNGCSIGKHCNAGMARVQGFPVGRAARRLSAALYFLAMGQPLLQEHALHITTGQLAVARFMGKGQAQEPTLILGLGF